jgi:hypothetical protein
VHAVEVRTRRQLLTHRRLMRARALARLRLG